jgi:hypothetical protein
MARTYGRLALASNDKQWIMEALEPHVAIRLKQLFPRIPKHQAKEFTFPNDDTHCADLSWFCARYPLAITESDRIRLDGGREDYGRNQAELERILLPDYEPPTFVGLKPGQVVRRYQARAIDIAYRRKSLLLADYYSLGKTYTAAGFLLKPGVCRAAVVVEAHLQDQWAEKLEQFTSLRVHKIKGTRPYDLPPADVYLFRYTQLAGWVDIFNQGIFVTAVFDEIQQLRTGTASAKGAAALVLANAATYRLGLSATPIYGYGVEIWNIMQYVDSTVLGTREEFIREWTDDGETIRDPDALGTFLREQNVFLRRTKADVREDLGPGYGEDRPINRIVERVESDPEAIQSVWDIAQALALRATTGEFTQRGQAARELDMLARQATGVGKARGVAAFVRILLESKVPVMLGGWHRDVYDIWLKELAEFKPVMYTGSESPKQKNEAKRAFINGETDLFIMSIRSGAGIDDLQHRCSTAVVGELDWSPKVIDQFFGRLDREGQREQVTGIFLNSDDGSDPPMVALLGLKSSQADGIVDPGKPFEVIHSDESRIQALARQFLARRRDPRTDARAAA